VKDAELKDESHYRKILPKVYEAVKTRMHEKMANIKKFAFTSDGWSANDCSFLRFKALLSNCE
jgi:hypothetical protein